MADLALTWSDIWDVVQAKIDSTAESVSSEAKRYTANGYRHWLGGVDPRNGLAHEWTFLKPWSTLTIGPTESLTVDGTGSHSGDETVLTLDSACIPEEIDTTGTVTFSTSSTSYNIVSVASDGSTITVSGDASGETASDDITASHTNLYAMPSDFSSLTGDMVYDSQTYDRMSEVDSEVVERIYQSWQNTYGPPRYFAIVPRSFSVSTGSRYFLQVEVVPSNSYTLRYRYRVRPDAPDTDGSEYPLGEPEDHFAIQQCALAAWEREATDTYGPQSRMADEQLAASITRDKHRRALNRGGDTQETWDRDEIRRNQTVTFS